MSYLDIEKLMLKGEERKYFVYTLAKPDGTVFYVGKGSGHRISCHFNEARRGVQSPKCDTIRQIWADGGEVVSAKVQENLTQFESIELELKVIRQYGIRNLTNKEKIPIEVIDHPHMRFIPAHISLSKQVRERICETLEQCLSSEGLELTYVNTYDYLQKICQQAILEAIKAEEKRYFDTLLLQEEMKNSR